MTADEEDNYHVAQANEALDAEGHFVRKTFPVAIVKRLRSMSVRCLITWTYLLRWYSL